MKNLTNKILNPTVSMASCVLDGRINNVINNTFHDIRYSEVTVIWIECYVNKGIHICAGRKSMERDYINIEEKQRHTNKIDEKCKLCGSFFVKHCCLNCRLALKFEV